ncbi:hypothetical protein E2C01_050175 [Portunus trituberculatus]|uniref:Uncharacterized protein n=1 Tax=Portunus trituberculatus TaxID=210409 RepID=A0A5B7GBD0_PORTR|nr:hypothetical protein [Portunus trituberculatus]
MPREVYDTLDIALHSNSNNGPLELCVDSRRKLLHYTRPTSLSMQWYTIGATLHTLVIKKDDSITRNTKMP